MFLGLAFYTTFRGTIRGVYQWLSGGITGFELGSLFLEEASSKFLGAAVHLSEGVGYLVEWLTLDGVLVHISEWGLVWSAGLSIWTGLAGLYMALFLYGLIAGKGMDREISWHEQALVLLLVLSVTANVHGVSVLDRLLENMVSLADTVGQAVGELPVNGSENGTMNGTEGVTGNSTG